MADDLTPLPFTFPSDPRDGWEPGAPSARSMVPSAIGGGVVPIAVYFLVRHFVATDAPALAVAGVPAAVWVGAEWLRRRTVDPVGAIVLVGFVAGITASFALGGNAFVLKVRDSAFTCLFGLFCLVTLAVGRRPVMFAIGRGLSAGDDPVRRALYDDLWDIPPARATFRLLTAMWGVGMVAEAAIRVVLAVTLPTGPFVVASPAVSGLCIGGLFAATVWFTGWARRRGEVVLATTALPEDGGSTWWWARRYLSRTAPPVGAREAP